jgi:peptidyl-Asp metalloendopeptidase
MRHLPLSVPVLLMALLGVACSKNTSQVTAVNETDTAHATAGAASRIMPSRQVAAFASLPDRGNLIGYPAKRVARQERASTWHRADVSEEHALRAVVTGEMTVTTPEGQPIRLHYQRHLEHSNGNWTWIGRDEHGEEAIVTFGAKAVFGSIPRPDGEELRLVTSGGQSWVVEADPGKQHYPSQKRPDYVVPPELARSFVSGGPVTASASMEALTPAAVGTTVDVALGYTNGFASELGGDSQAVTRLQNLVDITNQAYANSQIDAQIRLVRAVRVNYPDATDNNDALAKLSGYESDVGNIPVDPAFTTLRAARDQYGADLVSLVRRFRTPENQGCGVAWLIGGDQSPIDGSDAPWGYSVVSDDLDRGDLNESDSKTYVCRKETLAHELGHNMGQAHNTEDSDGTPGAHSYSYGYREASSMGFYTVMAYRLADSNQVSIRYFANPRVSYNARPTGTATADNARSMAQTMPVVATFRSVAVPLGRTQGDFDGDGQSDVFWRNGGDGKNTIWRSANANTFQVVATVSDQAWKVVGVGDFDGDGRSDALWRNANSGGNAIWRAANSAASLAVTNAGVSWLVAGVGDFNGDGRDDILWRNADGRNVIWRSGNSATSQAVTASAASWQVAGIGDFNGDAVSDIFWRNMVDGRNVVWRSGNSGTAQAVQTSALAWKAAGVGDFDADGHSDILWRNANDGRNIIWRSAIAGAVLPVATVPNQAWKVAQVADFNGDGRSDVLWRLTTTGQNVIWRSANSATVQPVASANTAWTVAD